LPVASHECGRGGAVSWFLDPYVQIAIGALLITASELLLRRGAQTVAHPTGIAKWLGIAALASRWTWLGILTYILSFACWLYVLRLLPLSIAFPAINITHVLVPVGAWVFLGERIVPQRWIGIALVLSGILLIVGPVIRAEERL
jgi:drug/metabolite transporter (DMT)-like permease